MEHVQFADNLPTGVILIKPHLEKNISLHDYGNMVIDLTQIPFTPAFVVVVDRFQGATLDGVIIADLTLGRRQFQTTSLYVALTRVRRLRDVYFLVPPTKNYLQKFTPISSLIEEMNRLEKIAIT